MSLLRVIAIDWVVVIGGRGRVLVEGGGIRFLSFSENIRLFRFFKLAVTSVVLIGDSIWVLD